MGYVVNSWLTVNRTFVSVLQGMDSNVEFTTLPNYGRTRRECTVDISPVPMIEGYTALPRQLVQEGCNVFTTIQNADEYGELRYVIPPDGALAGELFILGSSNSPVIYVMQADDTDTPIITDNTYMYYSCTNYGYSLDEWHARFNIQNAASKRKVYKGAPNIPNTEDLGISDRYYFLIPLNEILPEYNYDREFNVLISSYEDFSEYSIVKIYQTSSFDQM